jgi:hypothetical protein
MSDSETSSRQTKSTRPVPEFAPLKDDPPSDHLAVLQSELIMCPEVLCAFLLRGKLEEVLVPTLALDLDPQAKLKTRQELIAALANRLKTFPGGENGARVLTLTPGLRPTVEEHGLRVYQKRQQ